MKILIAAAVSSILFSCGESKKVADTATQTAAAMPLPANEKQLLQSGNDFRAQGSSPVNWHLDVDYDKNTNFSSDDGLALTFASNTLKKTTAGNRTTYTGKVAAGAITIVTENGNCTNPQERMVYDKIVSVTVSSKQYSGCGKFLADANLGGKWQLEKIGYTAIAAADYNKIPLFNFDLSKNRVSGNDGCNSIGGNIEVQGSRIIFSQMMSTKMGCMKKSIENIISTQISDKLVDYYFKEGKLYLYLPDDSLLVFTKSS